MESINELPLLRQRQLRTFKLSGNKAYFPNKYFTPYDFLYELQKSLKGRFDLEILEVRYQVARSKKLKDFDDNLQMKIEPDLNFNNPPDDDFFKFILEGSKELIPPSDFDAAKFQEELEKEKKLQEAQKIEELGHALQLIVDVHQKSKGDLRSIPAWKSILNDNMRNSEYEIYVKALISDPVLQRIEQHKNSKDPLRIKTKSTEEIRVFLHTAKKEADVFPPLPNLHQISSFSLCCLSPTNNQHYNYFDSTQLQEKAQNSSKSILIQNRLALKEKEDRVKGTIIEGIQIWSWLFNEIVLKISIQIAQILKIQRFTSKDPRNNCTEYYIHLVYPPKYYLTILQNDLAALPKYLRGWERVQNFLFWRVPKIAENDFVRLYLFNNTIVKIVLQEEEGKPSINGARQSMKQLINRFQGNVPCQQLLQPLSFSQKIKYFVNHIQSNKTFLNKLPATGKPHLIPKIWSLKYFMLVFARFNLMSPIQIRQLMDQIEKKVQDVQIFQYVMWKIGEGINAGSRIIKDDIHKEYDSIKKLGINNIMKKLSSNTKSIAYVFKAVLTPSGYLFNPPTPEMKGRLLKEMSDQSQFFMRVSITDDSESTLKNQKYITKSAFRQKMNEIQIIGRNYKPLGWSPSQLRSFSLWYVYETITPTKKTLTRQYITSFLGNFDDIYNPAKKGARIGQNFSASWTYDASKIKQVVIEDIKSPKGHLFTDGIGKISQNLLQNISLKLQIRQLGVVQIRYKGAKGVLVLDESLPNDTVHLRKSMIKFECKHDAAKKYLDILDWNKYKAGFLNRQIIILLKTLGISDKVFITLQNQHLKQIHALSFKDCSIFKHLNDDFNNDINNLESANKTILNLLRAGFRLDEQPFFRGVLQTMKKNGYHLLKTKCQIQVKKSARIIGIIDQYGVLQDGQLFCTVYDHFNINEQRQNIDSEVIITRNPCLHPADIRKLKCVSLQQVGKRFKEAYPHFESNPFQFLINCVIFPQKGQYPVTSMISGSDLDGDNFFISWEPTLIPKQTDQAYIIDDDKQKSDKTVTKANKKVEYDDMLDFFIDYLNYEKLGQIDNSHLVHADRNCQTNEFARAKICIQLARIHGKAVDFPKTGFCPDVDPKLLVSEYPDFMEKENDASYISRSILGTLYRDTKQKIQTLLNQKAQDYKAKDVIDAQLVEADISKYKVEEIEETLSTLLDYEKEVANLINLVGVDTEFEIYSGNFTIAKDKVRAFGTSRLIASILRMKQKYFDIFFDGLIDKEDYTYANGQKELKKMDLFKQQTRRKAILYYMVSYIMKFPEFSSNEGQFAQHLSNFKDKIQSSLIKLGYLSKEGKFLGFVWFIVPKIITNLKYRATKRMELLQKKKEEEEIAKKKEQEKAKELERMKEDQKKTGKKETKRNTAKDSDSDSEDQKKNDKGILDDDEEQI